MTILAQWSREHHWGTITNALIEWSNLVEVYGHCALVIVVVVVLIEEDQTIT